MTKQILFAITVFTVLASLALDAQAASCTICEKADKLAKQMRTFNFTKRTDRENAGLKALDAVDVVREFEKMPATSSDRSKAFKSVLNLARETSPFDGEAQMSQLLAKLIKADAGLKAQYAEFVRSQPKALKGAESCKTQRLEASIQDQGCLIDAGKGQDPGDTHACAKPFDYEACLKGK